MLPEFHCNQPAEPAVPSPFQHEQPAQAAGSTPLPFPPGMGPAPQSPFPPTSADSYVPASAKARKNKELRTRTPDEMRSFVKSSASRVREGLEAVPERWPRGPFKTHELLEQEVVIAAGDPEIGGGGWRVCKVRVRPANTVHGEHRGFGCTRRHKRSTTGNQQGCECKWEVMYEWTTEGYLLYSCEAKHNHQLFVDAVCVQASSSGRYVPLELQEICRVNAAGGMSAADIFQVVCKESVRRKLGDVPTFTRDDIYEWYIRPLSVAAYDMDHLMALIEANEQKGLASKVHHTGGRISRIFTEVAAGKLEWALGGDENVLMFDPTHGSNRYGLKLCCFTTVAKSGQTIVLAWSLHDESADSIEWAFACFAEIFRRKPKTLFTDRGSTILIAFRNMSAPAQPWAGTVHLFCIYHLSCNLYTHVHPLFTGKPEEWKHVHDLFWKIAKETDRNTQCCFDSDWAVLLEYVEGALDAGVKRDAALVWLRDLGGLAKQWAARFTWESITWGVHSTQRAESMQMIVKGFLKATTCVSQLAIDIEQYNARARHLRAEDDVRKALRQHASSVVLPPWAAPWREKLTPYGFDLFAAQFTQALQYSVSLIVNDGAPPSYKVVPMVLSGVSVHLVYDEDGHVTSYADLAEFGLNDESHLSRTAMEGRIVSGDLSSCTCQLPDALGVACRHIIRTAIHLNAVGLPDILFGKKWLADFDPAHELRNLVYEQPPRRAYTTSHMEVSRMSVADRASVLLSDLRPLIDVGSRTDANMKHLQAAIPAVLAAIQAGRVPQQAEMEHELVSEDDEAPHGESGQPKHVSAAPVAAEAPGMLKIPSRDGANFQAMCGTRFERIYRTTGPTGIVHAQDYTPPELCADDDDDTPCPFPMKFIGYKFSERNKGGWYFGEIKGILTFGMTEDLPIPNDNGKGFHIIQARQNYSVFFPHDGETLPCTLYLDNYCTDVTVNQPAHTWVALQQKPLGDPDIVQHVRDGSVVGPPSRTHPGNNAQKRKAPQHGPMSRGSKK